MSRGHALRRGAPPTPGVAVRTDHRFRRADPSSGRRRRYGRAIWRAARWVVPALALSAVAAWLGMQALRSDILRVRRLVVRGNVHLSPDEVDRLLDGIRRENLLRADLAAYRQRLVASPWVADARLSRELPSTVDITIVERTPLAVARLSDRLFLVDDTGTIIDAYGPAYAQFDLPVVDGLLVPAKGAARPAAPLERAQLTGALLASLAARPDLRRRVSQIDVSNPHDAVVLFGDDPAWLHLGDARFAERLQNYVDLRPTFVDRFHQIDYVDLRFDQRVYLRAPAKAAARTAAR